MENPVDTGEIRDEKGRFKPGVSGNPAGKPPGSISIIAKIKKKFEEEPEFFDTYIAECLADPKLRAEIIRQIDGAPKQSVDLEAKGSFTVEVVSYKENEDTPSA